MKMIKLYQVGGSIRDEILGIKSKDIDYAVEASSYDEMRDYILKKGTIFLEKPEYLTIRAKINNEAADFVLCRKDGIYKDNRHPEEVYIGTIDDDLSRRDFTVNAIAKREDGTYYDPHDGINDCSMRLLKCVGNTYDRFNEDALRMLRAIRFNITKGLYFDQEIREALYNRELIDKLENISIERIYDELSKCFKYDTIATIYILYEYPEITEICFSRNMWLKPTLELR